MREKLKNLLLSYWGTAIFALTAADAVIFYWYASVYMRHRLLFHGFLGVVCFFAVVGY